jgi:hypothetical protein
MSTCEVIFVKSFLFPHQTTKLALFCQEKFYKKLMINYFFCLNINALFLLMKFVSSQCLIKKEKEVSELINILL